MPLKDPVQRREYRIAYRIANPMADLIRNARKRARDRGRPFDEAFMRALAPATHCQMVGCGVEFVDGNGKGAGPGEHSRTLDEILPPYGYVEGNVAQICHSCNNRKGNATEQQLANQLEYVRRSIFSMGWT